MNYDNPRGTSRYSSLDDLRFEHQIDQRQAHIAGWRRNFWVLVLIVAAVLLIFVLRRIF